MLSDWNKSLIPCTRHVEENTKKAPVGFFWNSPCGWKHFPVVQLHDPRCHISDIGHKSTPILLLIHGTWYNDCCFFFNINYDQKRFYRHFLYYWLINSGRRQCFAVLPWHGRQKYRKDADNHHYTKDNTYNTNDRFSFLIHLMTSPLPIVIVSLSYNSL